MTLPIVPILAAALADAQAELKNPPKNREVTVRPREGAPYSFSYATLDGILDMARPVLAKHGLSLVQVIAQENGEAYVRTYLLHKSGEQIHADVKLMIDRAGNQAMGSAMTYARRYGILGLLCLAADDDEDANAADGNVVERSAKPGDKPATPPARQAPPPRGEPAHVSRAKAALKGANAASVRQLHQTMKLADWNAVANLSGEELSTYVKTLELIEAGKEVNL